MPKHYRDTSVYQGAKERVREANLGFDDFYVSFSGGQGQRRAAAAGGAAVR